MSIYAYLTNKLRYAYNTATFRRQLGASGTGLRIGRPSIGTKKTYIGNNVHIGSIDINGIGECRIGDDVRISQNCVIITSDHAISNTIPYKRHDYVVGDVTIHNGVWIGYNVIILKGVTIGQGAIIGAGAVVTKSVPNNEIWAGNPAHKIGQR